MSGRQTVDRDAAFRPGPVSLKPFYSQRMYKLPCSTSSCLLLIGRVIVGFVQCCALCGSRFLFCCPPPVEPESSLGLSGPQLRVSLGLEWVSVCWCPYGA